MKPTLEGMYQRIKPMINSPTINQAQRLADYFRFTRPMIAAGASPKAIQQMLETAAKIAAQL